MRPRSLQVPSSRLHPLRQQALSLKVWRTPRLRWRVHNTSNKRHSMIHIKTMVQDSRITMEVIMRCLLLQSRSLREPASRKMGKFIFPFFDEPAFCFCFFLFFPSRTWLQYCQSITTSRHDAWAVPRKVSAATFLRVSAGLDGLMNAEHSNIPGSEKISGGDDIMLECNERLAWEGEVFSS